MINLSALKNKPESSKVENTTIEISIISTIITNLITLGLRTALSPKQPIKSKHKIRFLNYLTY